MLMAKGSLTVFTKYMYNARSNRADSNYNVLFQSRKGAINLTGANVSIPSGDMGISYGFLLRAPHTSNKRE